MCIMKIFYKEYIYIYISFIPENIFNLYCFRPRLFTYYVEYRIIKILIHEI